MMEWLVLVHVLSAVLGLGPAYAFPFMLNKKHSPSEMLRTLEMVGKLEMFPKVFGTIAVLSGLILFWLGSYGPWTQIWILGTLFVYAATEVLVIAGLNPQAKRLRSHLEGERPNTRQTVTSEETAMYVRVRNLHLWAGILGLMIFGLMIMKP